MLPSELILLLVLAGVVDVVILVISGILITRLKRRYRRAMSDMDLISRTAEELRAGAGRDSGADPEEDHTLSDEDGGEYGEDEGDAGRP